MQKQQESKQMLQLSNKVLMIRPYRFRSNQMTCVNNYYQQQSSLIDIHEKALNQFDTLVNKLRNQGVQVIVVQDDGKYDTPDSVFPNNWISFHHSNKFNLYPMFAVNRRTQRKLNIFTYLKDKGLHSQLWKDYSDAQNNGQFLEGTGSLVLDRVNRIAYAAISDRTNEKLAMKFCEDNGYRPCFFKAYQTIQGKRKLIYHTNVVMWIGWKVCGVCLDCIDDQTQKEKVRQSLSQSHLQIVELSEHQIGNFAGNCLMLMGKTEPFVVMSNTAESILNSSQKERIGKIVHCDIKTIEDYGGGSARCTIAELF